VPWTSKAQRLFDESDLPGPEQKLSLYNLGKTLLLHAGYTDIGMDHFALPDDALYQAWKAGRLHRNFMGYTTQATGMLLGLGVSAISDCGDAFAQNTKTLHDYYARVEAGTLPVQKGYFLSPTDLHFRRYIQDLACKGHTEFQAEDQAILQCSVFPLLEEKADGLADWNEKQVWITETGHAYIRPVCSAFDLYLRQGKRNSLVFSQAI
jgi:oxygen-independent coproporphyrinogen-3 oxidase